MERMWAFGGFDGFRQKQDAHENLPRFGPPEGKDIHPACLILYCWYMWSCTMVRRWDLAMVERDGVASLCEIVFPPMRVPLVALYMQPVRVYK
jgi:hypothetical protein